MGRTGAGSGGGSRSSGGHSSHRSSGGHRVDDGRTGSHSSRQSSSHRSYSGGRGYYSGGHRHYRGRGNSAFNMLAAIVVLVMVVLAFFMQSFTSSPKSSYARTKLDTGVVYNNNCIVDELGWFDNVSKTEKELQYFYNKTGVQPYIVLRDYDSTLESDSDKEKWANDYYTSSIDNESTFLFVYFDEKNGDDVGYMCYVNGKQVSSVMDAEAVDIFWNYIDRAWVTDMSTDDVFIDSFKSTADTIMTKSKTVADVVTYLVIGVVIIGIFVIAYKTIVAKNKRDKERAEETERILNTPLQDLSNTSDVDDIVDKYN